ncbi:MAG: hypothetical protein ABI413_05820 [Ktedonobacteraceae bacterium]
MMVEPIEPSSPPAAISSNDQDALRRLNLWLDALEEKAKLLLDAFNADELEPAQAAAMAGKYITLIARLLELRQQFTTESTSVEDRLLSLIFGKQTGGDDPTTRE